MKHNSSVSTEGSIGNTSIMSSSQGTVNMDRVSPVFFQNVSYSSDPLAVLRPLEEAAQICKSLSLIFSFDSTFTRTIKFKSLVVIKNTGNRVSDEDTTTVFNKEKSVYNSGSDTSSISPKSKLSNNRSSNSISTSSYSLIDRSVSRGSSTDTSATRRDSGTSSSDGEHRANGIMTGCRDPSNNSKDNRSDASSTSSGNMNDLTSKPEGSTF